MPYTSKSCKDNEYVICIFELSTNALLVLDVRTFFLRVFVCVWLVLLLLLMFGFNDTAVLKMRSPHDAHGSQCV